MRLLLSGIDEAQRLLLAPTPDNIASATSELEAVALELCEIKVELERGGRAPADLRTDLFRLTQANVRVRRLLRNAATVFGTLRSFEAQAQYGRTGLLEGCSPQNRKLAEL